MHVHLIAAALLIVVALVSGGARANEPPDADDMTFDTDEDKPLAAKLKASDGDQGDALTFALGKAPKNGTVAVETNGKFAYTPKKDFHGNDEFTFTVSDGKAKITKKATVAVSSSNDHPISPPLELKGQEDKQVKGQLAGKDADGDPIIYSVLDSPPGADVDVDGRSGKLVYTPAPNQNGTVSFFIRMSDGTVDVKVPVTVTLEPSNDPPTADDHEGMKTKEDDPLRGKISARDVDDDPLTFTITEKPAHGSVALDASAGTFVYTPASNYAGDDAFGFSVTDGGGKNSTAKGKINIEVVNVNDAPTISPLALEGTEDEVLKGKVLAKDPDGDAVYFTVQVDPKHGEVEIDHTSGELTYTPVPDYFGPDTFTLLASDIAGGVTAAANVTIKSVNDAPVANPTDSAKGVEDLPAKGKLKATDVDKDALVFSMSKPPKNGAVEIGNDGSFQYTPKANFNGDDVFEFQVSDGKAKSEGSMTVNVKAVNDTPATADVKIAATEDTAAKGSVAGSDIDKDKLTWTLGKKSKKGKVSVDDETGSFVYEPARNENGEDTFSVKVSDGTAEVESNVTVGIAAVNDVPVASAHENKGNEDEPIKGNAVASDVDKDTLTFTVTTKPKSGTIELDPSSGAYTYAPRAHFNGDDAFRFEVTDGKLKAGADVKLTIAAVNDAPDVKNLAMGATEDKPTGGTLAASDIDKDKLTWSVSRPPTKGAATVDAANGKFTYTPRLNENAEDTFVLSVSDGNAKSDATVTVAIEAVNDVPVASAHQNNGNEDEPLAGKLVASDVDKDTLTFTAASKPRFGAVVVDSSTGGYTYTPNAHANGEDGFRFEVTDGKLKTSAEVKLIVAAVNDTPEPKNMALTTSEDREVSGKVAASDIDKDALTFKLKKAPAKAIVLVDDSTGAFRYVPTLDVHGPDTFVIEASDGFATADATVTVEVAPAPDAPLVDLRAIESAEDEPVTTKLLALDPDGEEVTFKILAQPKLATAEIEADGRTLKLTPKADVHGEDQLVVEASDGKHKVKAVLPVLLAARNDAPTIDEAKAETPEETPVSIALVGRDKDGDPVKLALVDGAAAAASATAAAAAAKGKAAPAAAPAPSAGGHTITLSSSILRVVPRKDFAGPIEVTVVPSDPSGKGAPMKVVINVVNVNDAPVAKDLALKAAPGVAQSGAIEASDVDAGDELTFSIAVPPRQGTLAIDDARTGKFTYTAATGARGDDSFRIRVKDKAGASVSATVRVTVVSAKPAAQGA